jgi:hypothetical protein
MTQFQVSDLVNVKIAGSGRGRPQMAKVLRKCGCFTEVQFRLGRVAKVPTKAIIGQYTKVYNKKAA